MIGYRSFDNSPCERVLHLSSSYSSVASLYIKRGKVSVRTYVRSSVTLGVDSSVANDVAVRMTS